MTRVKLADTNVAPGESCSLEANLVACPRDVKLLINSHIQNKCNLQFLYLCTWTNATLSKAIV